MEQKYIEFLEDDYKTGLFYAPTQVGKTLHVKDFINICTSKHLPVIISCDNKTDQIDQFYQRISDQTNNIVLLKILDRKFSKKLRECFASKKQFIIFCLDNAAQVRKVKEQIALIMALDHISFQKIVVLHDEGDIITKDVNIDVVEENQAQSHQEWLRLFTFFEEQHISMKRVFVTATPENIVYKYDIQKVIQLPVTSNYIGYEKIKYKPLDNEKQVKKILVQQEKNLQNGIILYNTDRKIEKGQDVAFKMICGYLGCVVNTYNGEGIVARIPKMKEFEQHLPPKTRYIKQSEDVISLRDIPIADFYEICRLIGHTVIVTIGMDLLSRGISFVSREKTPDAIAAVTMIYKPGVKMHAVGLCQAIGRITGTARPDLPRSLYAPQDVIEAYKNFNENQRQYLSLLTNATMDVTTKDIMKNVELVKRIGRPLDRPKLKLQPVYKKSEVNVIIDGVQTKNIKRWINNNSVVGRILRYLVDKEEDVSIDELKEGIGYEETIKKLTSNIDGGRSVEAKYGKLWTSTHNNTKIKLNHNLRKYLSSN
jgi:hypothetical protein